MSILNAYTLYDVKALTYNPPFFTANHGLAKRMLQELVTDTNTTVGRHPSDFKLYQIGVYDDNTGDLAPLKIMEHVVDAIALVAASTPSMFNPAEAFRQLRDKGDAHFNGEAK